MNQSQVNLKEFQPTSTITVDELDGMIRAYRTARTGYEDTKKISNEAHAVMKDRELVLMTAMNNMGKSKYHHETIGTISIANKYIVRTPKTIEEKQKLFEYIRSKFGEDVLVAKTTIIHQTLNSFYRDESKEAEKNGVANFSIPGIEAPVHEQVLSIRKPSIK